MDFLTFRVFRGLNVKEWVSENQKIDKISHQPAIVCLP